ncbi:MAG: STT3 domain-containing protein, partial [Methanobacterium sp.]
MSKKEIIIIIVISLIIFSLGFFIRFESTHLTGVPENEKAFYQDENNLPYMYDMDSYYNYRLTVNYLNHGYLGDSIINGEEWDLHSYYPPGVPMDYPPLITYLTAFLYNFLNLFSNVPLMTLCFWLSAFISPLAGVLAFFLVRRFTNDYGAAAAGILTVIAPFYFMRTVPGWFDTDMFNLIFPFIILWSFLEALWSKNVKLMVFFAFLSGFFMFIFALAWNGWQYLFYVVVLFSTFYGLWHLLKGKTVQKFLIIAGIFLVVTLILIYVSSGIIGILKVILGPTELLAISQAHGLWYPWPNVYNLISELQTPSLGDIISGIGPTLLGLGLFGIISTGIVLKRKNLKNKYLNKNFNWPIYIFFTLWIITGFLALIKGIRFILLIIPPLSIFAGISVGLCIDFVKISPPKLKTLFSIVLLILVSIFPIMVINDNFSSLNPRMNDDLWNAGEWIHNNTPENTVVITNWVYGHFFTAISDRPTTFDGRLSYIETSPIRNYDQAFLFVDKSPSTAREYWIDKAFTTSNENLSVGILRMLSTSGDL